MVTIHDIVVPVAPTKLQNGSLEAEFAGPGARFGRIAGKRQLAIIAIPRADQVDGLDIAGSSKLEVELHGRHVDR
jgi:hypothetical protein